MKILKKGVVVRYIHHLADIHIHRSTNRYEEYRIVFERLYENIMKFSKDGLIVLCGDIVDFKTDSVTNDGIMFTGEFLKRLSMICDVIIIAGNHDVNQNNRETLDTIQTVLNLMNLDNVYYLRETGLYQYADIIFSVVDIFDQKVIPASNISPSYKKIALFHGTLYGSSTESVTFNDASKYFKVEDFKGYDYVLLGDIHKHQYLNQRKTIAYPSSLIQQNFGESINGHGYIRWDLCKEVSQFIPIKNDYGFINLHCKDGKIKDLDKIKIPKKAKLKVFIEGEINGGDIDPLMEEYGDNLIRINSNRADKIEINNIDEKKFIPQNKGYLEDLVREYCKSLKYTDGDIDGIVKLNNGFLKKVNGSGVDGLTWTPISLKWDNMFVYGEKNEINFQRMGGVIGLFAMNRHGKSSIMNIIFYMLYYCCINGARKDEILNNKSDNFSCEFIFETNGEQHKIVRSGKAKGKTRAIETRTELYKMVNGKWLNSSGDDILNTNKRIAKLVGSTDDLLNTNVMLSSHGHCFTELQQSVQKDRLMRMLRLNLLDDLLKLGKSAAKDLRIEKSVLEKDIEPLKHKIPKINKDDMNARRDKLKRECIEADQQTAEIMARNKKLYQEIGRGVFRKIGRERSELEMARKRIVNELDLLGDEVIDDGDGLELYNHQKDVDNEIRKLHGEIIGYIPLKDVYREIMETLQMIDDLDRHANELVDMENKFMNMISGRKRVEILKKKRNDKNNEITKVIEQLKELNGFEFNRDCYACQKNPINIEIGRLGNRKKVLEGEIFILNNKLESLDVKNIEFNDRDIDRINDSRTKLLERLKELGNELSVQKGYDRENDKVAEERIRVLREESIELGRQIDSYNQKMAQIKGNRQKRESMIEELNRIDNDISQFEINICVKEMEGNDNRIKKLECEKSAKVKEMNEITRQMEQYDTLYPLYNAKLEKIKKIDEKLNIHEKYVKIMDKNGLQLNILENVIPNMQKSVNRILSLITDFNIRIKIDGDRIIMDKYGNDKSKVSIGNCSGFEKFMINLAFRLTFINYGLVKTNFIVMDECFGCVDIEHREKIVNILEYLRENLKFAIVISHEDSMKNYYDDSLRIERVNGQSRLVYS